MLQTVAIPRGQVALAAGQAAPDADRLVLTAERGQTEYGICSTAFLEYAFRTDSYRIEITFNPDGSWSYVTDTMLTVRGRPEPLRASRPEHARQDEGGSAQPANANHCRQECARNQTVEKPVHSRGAWSGVT